MKTHTNSKAQNFGHNVGKAWLWVKRKESAVVAWLSAKGLPPALAKLLVFLVNIAVVAVLLYAAFRLVVVVGFVFCCIAALKHAEPDFFEPYVDPDVDVNGGKWEYGPDGFGYYINGYRADGGNSD